VYADGRGDGKVNGCGDEAGNHEVTV